jgi:hypothetical protein
VLRCEGAGVYAGVGVLLPSSFHACAHACSWLQSRPSRKALREANRRIESLEEELSSSGVSVQQLHGDLSQRVRAASRERSDNRKFASTRSLVQRDKAVHRLQVRATLPRLLSLFRRASCRALHTVVYCRVLSHCPVLCAVVYCRVGSQCRVVSCRVVSCRVVSCRVVSCRVVSCRVVSCRVVSCRVPFRANCA